MNLKLSLVLALMITGAFPALTLYAWQNRGAEVKEEDAAVGAAMAFVKNGATYGYDGIPGTLAVRETRILESYPVQYVVVIAFESRHAGYGDRTGQILAQVITPHTAEVKVVQNTVVSAVLDGRWDELNQREIEEGEEPQGIVTPESALNTAIRYVLVAHDEVIGVEAPSSWEVRDLTPEGLVGVSEREYTAEGWTVTMSWAVVRFPVYEIEMSYTGEGGFRWEGSVDQDGAVTEVEFELAK
jgi:hypothetical protein